VILVVDDEPESRTLLTTILSAEGYEVHAADGGRLALASLAVTRPELILLDIRMPDMDGFEVCRKIKANAATQDIPLMFLSGRGQLAERVGGFRLGAVDFVTKPFQREELLARVRTHLELGRLRTRLEEQVAERTAELRESEQRFRTMADSTPVMIWAAGTDKLCSFVNKTWLDFTGRSIEQDLGDGWIGAVHPNDREACSWIYSSSIDGPQNFHLEFRLRRADGEYRWVAGSGVPRFSDTGAFVGYIGSCVDVTESRVAAEQLRALSAFLISAQEEERSRISRELHDDLVQRLALMAIDLGKLISQTWPSLARLPEELRGLQERAIQAAELTRHIAHELHPMTIEDLGLATALRSLCEDFARREEIDVEFAGENLPHAPKRETASCLYSIAQEALLNISKHAHARHVRVELKSSEDHVSLSIADDGIGFPTRSNGAGMGLGVLNMRERVGWLKGSFSLESEPGRGTQIAVAIPLQGAPYETRAHSARR
jgi:PAS domain S-box-containing protein